MSIYVTNSVICGSAISMVRHRILRTKTDSFRSCFLVCLSWITIAPESKQLEITLSYPL